MKKFQLAALLALASSQILAGAALASETRTIADCTDSRGSKEVVTQVGDRVTVLFKDGLYVGRRNQKVTYEKMNAKDADEFGFKLKTGMAAYIVQGDDDEPNLYVVLPEHMDEINSARFEGSYGSNAVDESFDESDLTPMHCTLR